MSDFMLEKLGGSGLYAVFHQDAGQGFFFLYRSEANEVLVQERVYAIQPNPPITEADIQITWPTDSEAMLAVRGRTVCRINAVEMKAECLSFMGDTLASDNAKASSSIEFKNRFRADRRTYWKAKADQ